MSIIPAGSRLDRAEVSPPPPIFKAQAVRKSTPDSHSRLLSSHDRRKLRPKKEEEDAVKIPQQQGMRCVSVWRCVLYLTGQGPSLTVRALDHPTAGSADPWRSLPRAWGERVGEPS